MIQSIKDFFSIAFKVITILISLVAKSIGWLIMNYRNGMSNSMTCLKGKTAIVTGGNSGVGYMTAMLLASRGCKVIIACRRNAEKQINEIKEATNNPNITYKHLDLCRFSSVRQFAESIKKEESKIDILINNAGIAFSDEIETEDGVAPAMQANFLGHFLLTHLLIDLLKSADEGRIVFLSSALSGFQNITAKKLYPIRPVTMDIHFENYSNSKGCTVIVAQEMAKKLGKYKIKVNAADPGASVTPIFDTLEGEEIDKTAYRIAFKIMTFLVATDLLKAAQTPFHLATSKEILNGAHYFRCVPLQKPKQLDDEHFCEEIWRESEKIVRLRPEERL
ncbi:retinol dehydrogenase 13-like isoform X3 [Coccinella septempunctata]|uniref:retinol dehydrogenase 13-like isoform X3 n=1 Tax=Coccinella septempunctata TaxID=41139 RepID=UPI001D084F98|nr:retinol dehydrogenase 13-like isoform X3 [Coccinella septempunctata]XP_044753570.1 retinol dehydrogenase 13-like isoform X3 [Coccinella septempunctata]